MGGKRRGVKQGRGERSETRAGTGGGGGELRVERGGVN